MKTSNIWENLDLKTSHPNLLRELKTQAQFLADKTNGLLYADVNPIDATNEITLEHGIVHSFYIYAPYLGNSRTLLFRVIDESNNIIIVDKINNSPKKEVKSIEDLIKEIEKIISSQEASMLISNLFESSKEAKR